MSATFCTWILTTSGHPEGIPDPRLSEKYIAEAVAKAASADLVVLTAGGYKGGESHDRIEIGVMPQVIPNNRLE
jgi:hypothetical protein